MVTSSYLPQAGRFLISEPFMQDENFQRTVVLLVEHGEQGSLGFVLNRRLQVRIGEVVEDLLGADLPVFLGGPVEPNTLHFVHTFGELPGARPVYEGLFWGGDFESLKQLARAGHLQEENILFFIGYSGWSPGQLDGELKRKSWIIAPENMDFVFEYDPPKLWRDLLQSLGEKYRILSNYPQDPRLN
ncbi:MAG: YqgE/AlgH family protein [Bacteroidetes bacterium]|nr:MAG: YqgE/AlgH family protein [Bacteroidota bacterium]